MKNPKKCLIVGCDGQAFARGLCDNCYAMAKKKVSDNITWEMLEQSGLCLPRKNPKKGDNPFARALKEIIK